MIVKTIINTSIIIIMTEIIIMTSKIKTKKAYTKVIIIIIATIKTITMSIIIINMMKTRNLSGKVKIKMRSAMRLST